jgi:cytochrome c553
MMSSRRLTPLRIAAASLILGTLALSAALAADKAAPAAATKAGGKPDAAKAARLELGRKLTIVAGCIDCHTPGTLYGAPDFARNLSGSELGWTGPWGTTYARNLTSDPETGLGYYSAKEIVTALKSGKRLDGQPLLPPMPWQNLAAMSDNELNALAEYLTSLKAVDHKVPDRLPPGTAPSGPALTFTAPSAWDAPRTPPEDATKR